MLGRHSIPCTSYRLSSIGSWMRSSRLSRLLCGAVLSYFVIIWVVAKTPVKLLFWYVQDVQCGAATDSHSDMRAQMAGNYYHKIFILTCQLFYLSCNYHLSGCLHLTSANECYCRILRIGISAAITLIDSQAVVISSHENCAKLLQIK